MNISRTFLIKEKEKIFQSPFEINQLKKDIKTYGKEITQIYLPLELLKNFEELLNFKINFKPSEIKLKKEDKKYYLIIKNNSLTRTNKIKKLISKDIFLEFEKLGLRNLNKIRMKKIYEEKMIFIDYYPKKSLILGEFQFKNKLEAKKFSWKGKEITNDKNYLPENLSN